MSRTQPGLPQLDGELFLTDGGLETTLIFHAGIDLPDFAAFVLFDRHGGDLVLKDYYRGYARIAERFKSGFILETPTWRANPDWGARLGYDSIGLGEVNRRSIQLLEELRDEIDIPRDRVLISGNLGPRGDGYEPGRLMTADEARDYHSEQIRSFAGLGPDLVSGFTINYVEEAIGIVEAARDVGLPVVIAFTVETDGALPTGQPLGSAIRQVDRVTSEYPAYYMINCAHPSHFSSALKEGSDWAFRIRGIRANASCRSHAELNDSTELDPGDPTELGVQYAELKSRFPQLTVFGGCCGTDLRHVERIAEACAPHFAAAGC